ncbi:hypothetical protein [Streptomyces sp. NPDC090021]|uniref:hypothetical protein n=1 Tax=Streptomyces sp. NPDC090021 TaxID=3365919 RepID=UPI00380D3931
MTAHEPRTQPQSRPVLRLGLLLVFGVVVGLLGMHGLGTAAALPTAGATEHPRLSWSPSRDGRCPDVG